MARSVIDPVSRIEGHLRVEMEVSGGKVTDAWVTGGLFRGMELILQNREPADAAMIAQRICGVCPISHAHAACFAGEGAYGITLENGARLVRNILEGSQFLHSHILWFYNLTGLDYVDPTNALSANVADTYDLANAAGTGNSDFAAVKKHLESFIKNGQLSIFSGNWFSRDTFNLPPELDLIATAHYLEALQYQAKASQISGLLGGKMPHIMTSIPGGTTYVPTVEKIDDALMRAIEIRDWVANTLIPDTLAIGPYYTEALGFGKGPGRYAAWGVFNSPSQKPNERYLPAGVIDGKFKLHDVDESLITEYTGHSYYKTESNLNPRHGLTDPEFPEGGRDLEGKYTWCKAPRYDGKPYEAGPLSRMLVAYMRGVPEIVKLIDSTTKTLGVGIHDLESVLGRIVARNLECLYIANLEVEWLTELGKAAADPSTKYFTEPAHETGEGAGMWEAPRGALYHFERIKNNEIQDYQIIIPTTWNISPRDADGVKGPMEQALIGCPVDDVEKPINALRVVHSFDPCVACAVHVNEPATGKHFEVVTNPWGVK
ncbi:MAG: nickel-dependent hydrogenase large subunit [bacterium]|nr:nickel-dependent hydrogenase large subunit [bacterium]